GCPLGINEDIEQCDIFPIDGDEEDGFIETELWEEVVHFVEAGERPRNYESAEANPLQLRKLFNAEVEKGFCEEFKTQEELRRELKGEPFVVSKVALAVKDGLDSEGNKRYRLLVDGKRSKINELIRVRERVQLPRVSDVVEDWRELTARSGRCPTDGLFGVLDFRDAFKLFPVSSSERPFNICCCDESYMLYNVLQFGFRSSPLLWARGAALFGRLGQLVLSPSGAEGRLSVYVDDPVISVVAEELWRRRQLVCLPILLWSTFNLPFSCRKGQLGGRVRWIGRELELTKEGIKVYVPKQKLRGILQMIDECLETEYVRESLLRGVCGRLCWIAQVSSQLTPFIAPLWRALRMASGKGLRAVKLPSVTMSLRFLDRVLKDCLKASEGDGEAYV
ncbi:hypothetical protein FOZ63_011481, partial [Perkinsus olseni]